MSGLVHALPQLARKSFSVHAAPTGILTCLCPSRQPKSGCRVRELVSPWLFRPPARGRESRRRSPNPEKAAEAAQTDEKADHGHLVGLGASRKRPRRRETGGKPEDIASADACNQVSSFLNSPAAPPETSIYRPAPRVGADRAGRCSSIPSASAGNSGPCRHSRRTGR
jgi:hypothetical protein